jgi:hypothetical protein
MKRFLFAAALAVLPLQAQATLMEATYTGHLSFGYDPAGIFGAPGAMLTGDAYVARYVYDPNVGLQCPGGWSRCYPSDQVHAVLGGTSFLHDYNLNVPSPFSEAVITINGKSLSIPTTYYGHVGVESFASFPTIGQFADPITGAYSDVSDVVDYYSATAELYLESYIQTPSVVFVPSLTATYAYTTRPGDDTFSGFGDVSINGYNAVPLVWGDLTPETLRVEAIPEPGSIWLVLSGLGFLAFMGPALACAKGPRAHSRKICRLGLVV